MALGPRGSPVQHPPRRPSATPALALSAQTLGRMNTRLAAIDKHRFAGLQDGDYSIDMTLLVLELKLPALPEHLTDAMLWSALASTWPKLLTWLLSFRVLAIFWIGDTRALSAFNAVNTFLLRLGLWRLALVNLLPFSTALVGEHGDHTAGAAIYAAHLFLLAGAQVLRHSYVPTHPASITWPNPEAARASAVQAWGPLLSSAVAFALAFWTPGYNMFALLPMLFLHFLHKLRPQETCGPTCRSTGHQRQATLALVPD